MATSKNKFYWVNQDAQSPLSKAKGDESREIRQFVQHQSLAARRLGELQIRFPKQLPGSSSSPTPCSPPSWTPRSKGGNSEPQGGRTSVPSGPEPNSHKLSDEPSNETAKEGKTPIRRKRAPKQRPLRRRLSSPRESKSAKFTSMQGTLRLTGSAVDPFNVTAQPINDESAKMLSYWSSVIKAGGNPYKLQYLPERFKIITPINTVKDEYISNALRYEHCLYALFAFMSVRLLHVSKIWLKGLKSPTFYMQKAVQSLRRRLEECQQDGIAIDRATIGAIAQITLADWTSGDLDSARIHLATLASLLPYVDIQDPNGRYLIETIRTADFQVAVESRTMPGLSAVPSFEPVSRERIIELELKIAKRAQELNQGDEIVSRLGYDPPSTPADILADLSLTLDLRLGWALEEILTLDLLNPHLYPIIRNTLDCLTIAKCVWRLDTASLRDVRYMCRWGRTQGHFLFTYGYDHANDKPTPQTLLTDCIRLALLIVLSLATNRMGFRAARRIGRDLFEACRRVDFYAELPRSAATAYLWALVTAAMVVEEGSEIRRWLLDRAADVAVELDTRTYEDLHEVMTGYLYSWTLALTTMRELVDRISVREAADFGRSEGYDG